MYFIYSKCVYILYLRCTFKIAYAQRAKCAVVAYESFPNTLLVCCVHAQWRATNNAGRCIRMESTEKYSLRNAHAWSNCVRSRTIAHETKVVLLYYAVKSDYTFVHSQPRIVEQSLHNSTFSVDGKQSNENISSGPSICACHTILYESCRRSRRTFVFIHFCLANENAGSGRANRLRRQQTIEWENVEWTRSVRMRSRTLCLIRVLSDKHAH